MKYIDAEKLIAEIEKLQKFNNSMSNNAINSNMRNFYDGEEDCCKQILSFIASLQQEQPIQINTLTWRDINNIERIINNVHYEFRNGIGEKSFGEEVLERFREERDEQEQPEHMIQWTGNNLKEVIDFTGKSPRFGEWFKSWDEFESYVHSHGDILKLFSEDGSHYEVPVGAWIVKTPDGFNIPSLFRFVQKPIEWSEEDEATAYLILKELEHDKKDSPEYSRHFARLIDWFTLRFKSLCPQPKQEQAQVADASKMEQPNMNIEWFRLAEDYTMHLDFSYCKTCDWMLHIWKKGCGANGEDLIIFNEQDTDPNLLLVKGEAALKKWLLENNVNAALTPR